MAFPQVDINKTSGNSGRTLPGFDHFTGLIFYGTAPVVTNKWATYNGPPTIKAQQIFSSNDATSCGIIPYSDNAAATGSFVITSAGAVGNSIEFIITYPTATGSSTQSLGVYTIAGGQNTVDLQGAALAIVINNGTVTHGVVASYNAGTDTMTLTAPKLYGVSLNTGSPLGFVTTIGGTFAATITQFSGGTASPFALWRYQIDEYFRKFPIGNLWIGIIAAPSSFNEIKTLQKAAKSKLRQVGIYDIDTTRASAANISGTILQAHSAGMTVDKIAPLSIVYSPNMKNIADLSTYPDQNINISHKVQCVISQDGAGAGALLYVRNGQTVGNIGIKLATIASSRVSASDAEVIPLFNVSDGVENNILAFANGQLSSSVDENLQAQLDGYRYTFFREFGDEIAGTYWTGNKTCVINSSDYANVNDNRTIDKAARILYSTLVPKLNSEIIFNDDGTLKDYTIEYFETLAEAAINNNMVLGFGAMPLISGFSATIDADQPVKQTGELVIDANIVQNGIARNIKVNLGYALAL